MGGVRKPPALEEGSQKSRDQPPLSPCDRPGGIYSQGVNWEENRSCLAFVLPGLSRLWALQWGCGTPREKPGWLVVQRGPWSLWLSHQSSPHLCRDHLSKQHHLGPFRCLGRRQSRLFHPTAQRPLQPMTGTIKLLWDSGVFRE